jgi:hypothetical protein
MRYRAARHEGGNCSAENIYAFKHAHAWVNQILVR